MCGSDEPSDRDPRLRQHYSPPDPGGRENGQHEPNRPWWSRPLEARWQRYLFALGIVAFGVTVAAACANPPDDDDRPGQVDTSVEHECADLDVPAANCEE